MPKQTSIVIELEPELRDAFMAEAEATHQPASEIVSGLVRDFVERRKEERGYAEFLRRSVERGRADIEAGRTHSNEEVEAEFAALRSSV